jgi:trans-2-enoyl-CoA reductase
MFDLLMSFEYPTQALEFSDENIEKLIMQIEPHLKLESVDLQVLQNALPKTKGSYTRDYFYSMLVEISTAFKMSVTDDISLRMYCAYVVKYKQYAEQLNKQNI